MGYTRSHSTRENIAGQIMKALLLLLVFSQISHGRPQIGSTEPEQQSIVSLQSGQQQFMNRLLQQIESNTTTNFVLSPHSIHSVFSQLLQGSGGRTKIGLKREAISYLMRSSIPSLSRELGWLPLAYSWFQNQNETPKPMRTIPRTFFQRPLSLDIYSTSVWQNDARQSSFFSSNVMAFQSPNS